MPTVHIGFEASNWTLDTAGLWQVHCDRRGVLVARHPYEVPQAGGFARARLSVPIFAAPVRTLLRFYFSDGYAGYAQAHEEIGYPAEDFPGCRFACALVNGAQVWRQDVHGANPSQEERFYEAALSAPGGGHYDVEFRVEDALAAEARFATGVYWALPRVELLDYGEETPPWGPQAAPRPTLRMPGLDGQQPAALQRVALIVQNETDIDRDAEPVVSGIPIPRGELPDGAQARLVDAAGTRTPCQIEPLAQWPDGSVKALELCFRSAPLGAGQQAAYTLEYGAQVAANEGRGPDLARQRPDGCIQVSTGGLGCVIDPASAGLVRSLTTTTGQAIEVSSPLLSLENYDGFPPRLSYCRPPDTVTVEQNGSLHACIVARGEYEPVEGDRGFSYEVRLHFFADSATVKLSHTFINTAEPEYTRLRTISIHLPTKASSLLLGEGPTAHAAKMTGLCEVRLIQDDHSAYRLYHLHGDDCGRLTPDCVELVKRGSRMSGWLAAGDGMTRVWVAGRWLWQQYPKALRVRPGDIQVDLFTCERVPYVLGADRPFDCKQGEAKTHELLVHLGPEEGQQADALRGHRLSAQADAPLFARACPEWYCDSGVFGRIAPADGAFPAYEAGVAATPVERLGHGGGPWWQRVVEDGGEDPETYMLYGMEDFGDNPLIWGYQTKYCKWANCEYDLGHALLMQFVRSGDPRFLRRGEQAVMHNRDVDVIHHDTRCPEDVGAPHGHWVRHTDKRPNSGHLWTEGMVEHYLLTGDRRSLQVARGMADYLVRLAEKGWQGGSERTAGWPLIALMGVYNATGDERYVRAATHIVSDAVGLQDPVRGVWSSRIYEQPAYEGGTTFMANILARGLMRYVEATGDRGAALAIVRAAWWIAEEALTGPEDGPQTFYKQTPLCSRLGPADPEALAYAFALSGHERLGRLARSSASARADGWPDQGVPVAQMRDLPRVLALLGPQATWRQYPEP